MNIHICHLYVLADPDNSKPYTDIPQRTRKMDQLYKKSSVVRLVYFINLYTIQYILVQSKIDVIVDDA